MCFSCDNCGYGIGNMMFVFERLASCFAIAAVITCLVATLMIMLGMGIGLGYNYCVIQARTHQLTEPETDTPNITPWSTPPAPRLRKQMDSIRSTTPMSTVTNDLSPDMRYFGNPGYNGGRSAVFKSKSTAQRITRTETTSEPSDSTVTTSSSTFTATSITSAQHTTVIEEIDIKPTMEIPLQKVDLLSFIKRLKESNKNVTLELIQ